MASDLSAPAPLATLPSRLNPADYLLRAAAERGAGDRPYLVSEQGTLSFAAADTRASRAAGALAGLGIEPEQRVVLLMQESLAFAACFWAVLRMGAVAVPVNPSLPSPDVQRVLEDSRATALIVNADLWPALAPRVRGLRSLRHVVSANGAAPGLPLLDDLAAQAPIRRTGEPMSPDDPAFWLYTSGSTGQPKAAVHLVRDLVHGARIFPGWIGLTSADLTFSAPRMYFAYGLGNSLLFPLATHGAAVIHPEVPTAVSVLRTLERFRPSVFFAGPALLQRILAELPGRDEAAVAALRSVRFTVSAGETLPAPIHRAWADKAGHEALDCVGSTENLTFYLGNRPGRSRPGSSGRPMPGFDLRLVGEDGMDAAPGESGVMWVRGPTAAARYWNRRALTLATMRGEWLVTGDRFRIARDGCYEFLGRDDDMLKVGGSWVAPVEVEQALLAHPAVRECAVAGRRDSDGLGQAAAFVVVRPGTALLGLPESLRSHLLGVLPAFKVPRWIEIVPELPRTATGKVQRYRLRAS